MTELSTAYLDVIFKEKFWSWTIVAILYLILGLMVRGALLNGLFNKVKDIKKEYYHELKSLYLKDSLYGWFFFLVSLVICILLWHRIDGASLDAIDTTAIFSAVFSFFWSILSHMKSFSFAQSRVLRKVIEEKELQSSLHK